MAERSTSDLSADADAYLAKFDPAQAGKMIDAYIEGRGFGGAFNPAKGKRS
jgi:hypothetical protein